MPKSILFTRSALPLILKAFGKDVNKKGNIVDAHTGEPVFTPEGDGLTNKTFGGIIKTADGSCAFIKKDLLSAIKMADGQY